MSSETFAYMHVNSASQGGFLDDESQAGDSKSLCLAVRLRGEVPHDVRKGGGYAAMEHEPITVLREWSASTVQFLTAFWNSEVLDEIGFDFVRPDSNGKEEVYATLTLNQVTVAFVELRSGNTAELMVNAPRALEHLGLLAQKITFKVTGASGPVEASYVRKANAS